MKLNQENLLYIQIEVGDRLLVNFNTPTGLPLAEINLKRKIASGYRLD